MVSEKKLEANRRNAAKSTGPRTRKGKLKAAMNALTHGITMSKFAILPNENEQEYLALHVDIVRDLQPAGSIQRELVDDIVQTRWRIRRLSKIEAQIMLNRQHAIAWEHVGANEFYLNRPEPPDFDPIKILALEGVSGPANLDLYRERLQRTFHTQLRELRKLRGETGQHGDIAAVDHCCSTGVSPVTAQIDQAEDHGQDAHGTEEQTAPGKNEPTAEHKSAGEKQLGRAHNVIASAAHAVADSLMLSMDDLKEVQRSVTEIDRPRTE